MRTGKVVGENGVKGRAEILAVAIRREEIPRVAKLSLDSGLITAKMTLAARLGKHHWPQWTLGILCFRDRRGSEILLRQFNAVPVGYKAFYGLDTGLDDPSVYEVDIRGTSVVVIPRLLWGGPQAAILVEEMAALGVQQVIGYGAAAAIHPDV